MTDKTETEFKVGDILDLTKYFGNTKRLCNGRKEIHALYGVSDKFTLHGEEFRNIEGHSNAYVSSSGRVVKITVYGVREQKQSEGDRYLRVSLKSASVMIHRAFIVNPKNLPCVNHKNGDKHDNRATNLEWVTYSENQQHSYDVLKRLPPHSKLNERDIGLILKLTNLGVDRKTVSEAFEVNKTTINDILNGKSVRANRLSGGI